MGKTWGGRGDPLGAKLFQLGKGRPAAAHEDVGTSRQAGLGGRGQRCRQRGAAGRGVLSVGGWSAGLPWAVPGGGWVRNNCRDGRRAGGCKFKHMSMLLLFTGARARRTSSTRWFRDAVQQHHNNSERRGPSAITTRHGRSPLAAVYPPHCPLLCSCSCTAALALVALDAGGQEAARLLGNQRCRSSRYSRHGTRMTSQGPVYEQAACIPIHASAPVTASILLCPR